MRNQAHFLVAEMAKKIATYVFEVSASADNRFYAMFKDGKLGDSAAFRFAELNWNNFIQQARDALQRLHDQPDTPEGSRVQIREALVLDNLLEGKMADGETNINDAMNAVAEDQYDYQSGNGVFRFH